MAEKMHSEITDNSAPVLIDHFVGQERMKRLVKTALEASWMDGTRLPHMLFTGPPGVGKTQLATILGKEMGVELQEQLAQNLANVIDVHAFLLQAKDKSVLLIDELDQLPRLQQVTLYRALENGKIFINTGTKRKPTTIKLESFSLIGCTNFPEFLLKPLRDRFKLTLPFDFYSGQELEVILKNRIKQLGWEMEKSIVPIIATRSRGTPRIGLKLLESTRRTARAEGAEVITTEHLNTTLEMEGIDNLSLTEQERKYLSIVAQHNNLVRLNVIATCMGQSSRGISRNLEPFLIRIGLLTKDPRNGCRMLTSKGIAHIKANPIAKE
jgi:Holliday junction DNA helicase RuvB